MLHHRNLAVFWIYQGFGCASSADYMSVLNMVELHRGLNVFEYACLWLCNLCGPIDPCGTPIPTIKSWTTKKLWTEINKNIELK